MQLACTTNTLDISTGGETDWTSIDTVKWVLSGITLFHFHVYDVGGAIRDSAVLLDNVVDPPVDASSTGYLLTFARMLSGEIDPHATDFEADAVASEEHQVFIVKLDSVFYHARN